MVETENQMETTESLQKNGNNQEEKRSEERRRKEKKRFPRWNQGKINEDMFQAVLIGHTWPAFSERKTVDVLWLRETMTQACDIAMPRVTGMNCHHAIY